MRLILLWTVIGAALGIATPANPVGLTNDGAQYLSAARNLRAGEGFATSILYFDEHYVTGKLPAPQTVWPPGYSAILAGFTALGLTEDGASRAVGIVALAAILAITCALTLRLTGSAIASSLASIWVAGVTEFLFYVRTPNTDLLFVALVLGALACVAGPAGASWQRWLMAGLLGAAAVYVRYAGVFLFATLGIWALRSPRHAVTPRERGTPLLALIPGGVLIALLMLRNLLLIGNLKGGNSKTVMQPLSGLLRTTFESLVDGLGGASLTDLRAGGTTAFLAALGLAALLAGTATLTLAMRNLRLVKGVVTGLGVLLIFSFVYLAGVIAISRGTMLTFGLRYLLPLLPCLVVVVVAAGWTGGRAARAGALATSLLAAIAGIGAFERRWDSRVRLATRPDAALVEWARSRAPGAPLLAIGLSQADALRLGGGVLVVPQSYFTARAWDAEELRSVAQQFGVQQVIVVKQRPGLPTYPGIAAELIRGRALDWLTPADETSTARILTVRR